MTIPGNADWLEFAHALALAAGREILPHFRVPLDIVDKGSPAGYDPVTVADRAAETVIRAGIARAYPGHGIRGEEHGWEQGTSRYTWVIDPIDGTKSFILGQLHWATLIANVVGAGVLGVIVVLLPNPAANPSRLRAMLATGVCGGLTTFSTMQRELLTMIDQGHAALALSYAAVSVVAGLLAVLIAVRLSARGEGAR